VQSSIAFTALARGNVAAAVCSASASSLLGIVLTPLLVRLTGLARGADAHPGAIALAIASELLLPFVFGQLLRPFIRGWVERRSGTLRLLDQGAILLVIYGAFSHAVVERVWADIPASALLGLFPLTAALLACALCITWRASGLLGFKREDRITALFCGSKKSLASGVPLATVLFPAQLLSVMVLPLVVFHQLQLMVCSLLAQRYARAGTNS
jgi:sodium/bile acid cotransporter 7